MENKPTILQSAMFRNVLIALAALVVALAFFKAGEVVGYHKATYSFSWDENYQRNFAPSGFTKATTVVNDFRNPHGAVGRIISVQLPTFIIQNTGEAEKSIVVSGDTTVRRLRDNVSTTELKTNENVVIIGEPDDQGRIRAKFIRLMPPGAPMMPAGIQK